jgi:dTDP-4-dehydrorhamnose 3,5-epimerase
LALALLAATEQSAASKKAAATLAVDAGIAAADAACCKALGRRNRSQNHRDAVALLSQVKPGGTEAANGLERLLGLKDDAQYGFGDAAGRGTGYRLDERTLILRSLPDGRSARPTKARRRPVSLSSDPDLRTMQKLPTKLIGPVLLAPTVYGDERGFFLESYRVGGLAPHGVEIDFVQDNHSRSRRGVVRGMHFQPGQAKLIRCARGAIFDVLVDIRPGSAQYGQWEGFTLDDVSHLQAYSPDGFAHGFCVLSDIADVTYKVSSYYDPGLERGFAYDDPDVAIDWPDAGSLIASARDREAAPLSALADTLTTSFPA